MPESAQSTLGRGESLRKHEGSDFGFPSPACAKPKGRTARTRHRRPAQALSAIADDRGTHVVFETASELEESVAGAM